MKTTVMKYLTGWTEPTNILLAASLGGLKIAIEQYVFSDWQFLMFLFVLIILDTLLGFYKAWKSATIESKAYARVLEKILLYGCVLIMANVLTKFTVGGVVLGLFSWLNSVLYTGIVVRESISILENAAEIKPDLLPTWLLKKLKKFDESGHLKDLAND